MRFTAPKTLAVNITKRLDLSTIGQCAIAAIVSLLVAYAIQRI